MPIRVLHVDDNPDETVLFKLLLDGHGDIEHVGSLNDPSELFDALAEREPDVLVMDYRLGHDVDVPSLLRRVANERPNTSVVCFTGYEHPRAIEEIKAAGVFAHVPKGSPFETVLDAIRSAAAISP